MTRALLSASPIAVLVAALVALKRPAWQAALLALAAAAAGALAFFGLGAGETAASALRGASAGLFPIGLVIVSALFTYSVAVESGAMEEIKRGLASLSQDRRFLALLVAWGFGNFMEGMAGFGTAVAIPCAILVGIGFDPAKAVLCCLVANTMPTAFGSVGVPTMALGAETGLSLDRLSSFVALLQCAPAALSPFLILFVADGWRGVRECWRLALVADISFLAPWLVVACFIGCELPDIAGGISVMAAFAAMGRHGGVSPGRQAWAWLPFAFVVAALGIAASLPQTWKISPGWIILAAAFAGGLCQGVGPMRLATLAARTLAKYFPAVATICAVLAMARIMSASGMTAALAEALVKVAGERYAALSSAVGALAGFVTGSGTSSNILFGSLQASVGTDEARKFLFAAANVMGAGIGKMICPQSLVLGCAAAGLAGREREIMLKAFAFFLGVLAVASAATCIAAALM